jgi:hypothetical protein
MPPRCLPAALFAFSCPWPGRRTAVLMATAIWHCGCATRDLES